MKFLKGLSRVFWTVLIVVLLLIGVLCILTISPTLVTTATLGIGGILETTSIVETFTPPFIGLFGGTSEDFTMSGTLNGQDFGEVPLKGTLNFDYATFIGLMIGLIGTLLIIICWRKKNLCLIGSTLSLVGTILVALQGVFFLKLNDAFVNESINQGGLFSASVSNSVVPIGGIICAICFALIFVVGLFHGIIEKGQKK